MTADLVIRSRRVVTPRGIVPASIHIRDGVILRVEIYEDFPASLEMLDAGDSVIMPGLVDTHVHFNEPGRTDWEGFETGTQAAVAGGVTTVVEMPLNSTPPTTTVPGFEQKLRAAEGHLWCDVGFWGGAVPGNVADLAPLYQAGVLGFKCFLVPSGVPDFAHLDAAALRDVCHALAHLNAVLLVHAELPGPIEAAAPNLRELDTRSYATWLRSRPRAAENEAVALLIEMARQCGTRIHVVHLSSADALPVLRQARAAGLPITVETCPHYLTLASEDIPVGATEFKCAPPIREAMNREALWAALKDGTIDLIVSDHSPSPPAMKCRETGDWIQAWGGIASVQLGLPVVWTAARRRGFTIENLTRWMCTAPAQMAGLPRKGALRAGADADLVIWNPDSSLTVELEQLRFRHKLTPYAGRRLAGVVECTFLRGRKVYEHGQILGGPQGRVLQREQA
jgi:allantoinase